MAAILRRLTPPNRRVMRVALATGARIGDVVALRPAEVIAGGYVERKTHKLRELRLEDDLRAELMRHTGVWWVFPGRLDPHKHRTRQAVWRDVKRAAAALGLTANVGCHTARKIYAVRLLRQSGRLSDVQRNLNHDRLSTTLIYALSDRF